MTSSEMIRAIENIQKSVSPVKLAKVSSISGSTIYITFFGDGAPSETQYPMIEGYSPQVNDTVLMLKQGNKYVMVGAVNNSVVQKWAAINHNHDSAYANINHNHDTAYAAKTHSHSEYSLTTHNHTGVYSPASHNHDGTYATVNHNHDTSYAAKSHNHDTSYAAKSHNHDDTYAPKTHSHSSLVVSGYNVKLGSDGDLLPSAGTLQNLGNSSQCFGSIYYKKLVGVISSNQVVILQWSYDGNYYGLSPLTNEGASLGTSSYKYRNVYARQFYQNGTAITTSDARKKNTIKDIGSKFVDFFKRLRPVTFKMNDGDSGREHAGFIAQEVEQAMTDSGIDSMEFAGICIDADGYYGLRYEEFIAIQTKVIQDLTARVEALEAIVNRDKEV